MSFTATVYRVLIASPSDIRRERTAIADAIHSWNSTHAVATKAVLLPVMWETDATPQTGERPQEIINKQLVRDSDILIGVFWTRVGTPTGKAESGTIEEIQSFLSQEKRVLLYFSERPVQMKQVNYEQHQRLEEFKAWARAHSIYSTYRTTPQLTNFIRDHLTRVLHETHPGNVSAPVGDVGRLHRLESMALRGAQSEQVREMAGDSPLDASFIRQDMSQKACLSLTGLGGYSTRVDMIRIRFSLRNEGQHPAQNVIVKVESGDGLVLDNANTPVIQPQAEHEFSFPISRPPREDEPPERSWIFTVRTRFRDGLGTDEAIFAFTFSGRDPHFTAVEDQSKAQLSRLCRYVRPAP